MELRKKICRWEAQEYRIMYEIETAKVAHSQFFMSCPMCYALQNLKTKNGIEYTENETDFGVAYVGLSTVFRRCQISIICFADAR